MIAHTLIGVGFDLGYSVVRENLPEHFEAGLPLPSKVGQHLSFLQKISGDCFVDEFFVVCDDSVCLQRLIQRGLEYLNVAETFKLFLLLNANAVFLLTLHEQFSWCDDAGNLNDRQKIGLFDFVVDCCVGFDLFANPFDGFAF